MKKFVWKGCILHYSLPVRDDTITVEVPKGIIIKREFGKHADKSGHYSVVSVEMDGVTHVGFIKSNDLKIVETKNILYVLKECRLHAEPSYESDVVKEMKEGDEATIISDSRTGNEFACVNTTNHEDVGVVCGFLPLKYATHESKKHISHDESFYEVMSTTRNQLPIYQFHFKSIGIFRSIFPTRSGCPRQGNVVEKTRGYLELTLDNSVSLDGLTSYSHMWILFVFHKNKISKMKYKIRPPRLDGKKKIGIFATRTPHRINPLGLSVCRIERIVDRKIFCSGIDLIDHTPVIDIKPYIQNCDRLEDTLEPDWVKKRHLEDSNVETVEFSDEARRSLEEIKKKIIELEEEGGSKKKQFFHFFDEELDNSMEEIEEVIVQVIMSDPRPRYMKGNVNRKEKGKLYGFKVDRLNVRVLFLDEQRKAIVKEIEDFGI